MSAAASAMPECAESKQPLGHNIAVQFATRDRHPSAQRIRHWAAAALASADRSHCQLCLRLVDTDEMEALNQRYRQRFKATNVLAFAAELPSDIPLSLLGDVVLCAPVVWSEADQLSRDPSTHWAHLVIHGTLHLLGHEHQHAAEATRMENLEMQLLGELGFNPLDIPLSATTQSS